MSEIEKLPGQLKHLGLRTCAHIFEEEANKAAKVGLSYTAFLSRLVDEEIAAKVDRSINARIAKAHFPMIRTLEVSRGDSPSARIRLRLSAVAFSGPHSGARRVRLSGQGREPHSGG